MKPYQPPGYWAALNFPTREWQKDTGDEGLSPRHVHALAAAFPHPAMIAFDAPSREECTCERPRSNIPQQALVLLNDPEFVEAARAFAAKALAERREGRRGAESTWAFERATGRAPKPEEAKMLLALLAKHRARVRGEARRTRRSSSRVGDAPAPKDVKPEELAAWTSVCRVILNLHETITRQ